MSGGVSRMDIDSLCFFGFARQGKNGGYNPFPVGCGSNDIHI